MNQFSRTELLLGNEGLEKLRNSRVAVFGIGGVGGFAVEALARSGIGALDLIDNDKVSLTNINRQIIATQKTIGKYKTDVAKDRILEINPECKVTVYKCFFMPDTSDSFDFRQYDYVIDAIDTVTGKMEIIKKAQESDTPVISCMGAGNKLDPTAFIVTDIYKTKIDPLAKAIRKLCKENNIKKLKVLYSREIPMEPITEKLNFETEENRTGQNLETDNNSLNNIETNEQNTVRKQIPGSIAFVPSVAGLIIAGEVIKDLTGIRGSGINLS